MIEPKTIEPSEVASHYDDLDPFYREIWGNHVHHGLWNTGREDVAKATSNLVDYLLERVHFGPEIRACDIGCGYGETAREIALKTGADVVGLTISPKQAEFAQTEFTDGCQIRYGNWMDNDLADASMDVLYAIESSEHMPDLEQFFAQARRVLKPGGRLVIFAWLEGDEVIAPLRRRLLEPLCREGRMRLNRKKEYFELLREYGFSVDKYNDLSTQVSRTWTICIQRLALKMATDGRYRRYVFSKENRNREFAKTLFRIRAAYALGAMTYGFFLSTIEVRS